MSSGKTENPADNLQAGLHSNRTVWLSRSDQWCVASLATATLLVIGFSSLGSHRAAQVDLNQPVIVAQDGPAAAGFQLDVNRADWPEWTLLPRIGETLARRIVTSREQDGPFQSHDDLQRVSGIGPKTLFNMRPYLLPIKPAGP